ncbi:hypothetical protein Dimus_036152 [Dionaea muscipula]
MRFESTQEDWGALSELIRRRVASWLQAEGVINSDYGKALLLANGELLGDLAVGRLCHHYRMLELHYMVSGSLAVATLHAILGILLMPDGAVPFSCQAAGCPFGFAFMTAGALIWMELH